MKKQSSISRRYFLATASATAGSAAIAQPSSASEEKPSLQKRQNVWVASLSLDRMQADSVDEMVNNVIHRMEGTLVDRPDIICIPETFPYQSVPNSPPMKEIAEVVPGKIVTRFAEFAKQHHCYVICPLNTKEGETYYNSAVVIDRQGGVVGAYHKIHPTVDEIESGVTPGPLQPPVFQTDFGTIGIQICFDVNWPEGWRALRQAGAEIIFWPSAFPGGRMLNALAWMNKVYVVTGTWPTPTRIIDVTGDEIASSGRFEHWVCAPVNLEKALVHIWPYVEKIDALRAKYGQKVRVSKMHLEDWAVIESVSPDLPIEKALQEFEIPLHEEHIRQAREMQEKART